MQRENYIVQLHRVHTSWMLRKILCLHHKFNHEVNKDNRYNKI